MKKLSIAILSLLLLTGCTDAVAKLKDSNTVLFSVGSTNVTKGELYSYMASSGGSAAISDASTKIAKIEIEVTDDMKASAEETLEAYKSYYGDTFTKHLEQIGMTEEEYVEENLIASQLAAQLPNKYVESNFDSFASAYSPIKAIVINFPSKEDADAAISELKSDDSDVKAIIEAHNSTSSADPTVYTIDSTVLDSVARTVLNSSSAEDGWVQVENSDGSTYTVLKVIDNVPANFKEEAIAAIANITTIQEQSTQYWFSKYNFHIYDKNVYDDVKANYSNYLVQDLDLNIKNNTETESE